MSEEISAGGEIRLFQIVHEPTQPGQGQAL